MASGAIGPTLAYRLCAFPTREQDALIGVIERHGLAARDSDGFIYAHDLPPDE